MKNSLLVTAVALMLMTPVPSFAIDRSAIPETGTLPKSPVGSMVEIDSVSKFGTHYQNFFEVNPDHTLKFVYQVPIYDK